MNECIYLYLLVEYLTYCLMDATKLLEWKSKNMFDQYLMTFQWIESLITSTLPLVFHNGQSNQHRKKNIIRFCLVSRHWGTSSKSQLNQHQIKTKMSHPLLFKHEVISDCRIQINLSDSRYKHTKCIVWIWYVYLIRQIEHWHRGSQKAKVKPSKN